MAALDASGGRRFHDEWLERHFQSNSGLSNIPSIPKSPTPPDEDGLFEHVDEETYEAENQDMVEMEAEEVPWEDDLVNGASSSMSAAHAMNAETNGSPQDVGGVYTFFDTQISKLKKHCEEQIEYNEEIQTSIKSMAEACDEINSLKEMVSKLQEQVANLQNQLSKPPLAGESTEGRKRGRTRRSSPM
ncbi:unnamed protein product [Penicillium manginii]